MTVKRVTDMMDIMQIVPIEVRLREKEQSDVPVKDILTFINAQLQSPYFAAWIVTDNDIVLGYVFTLINAFAQKEMMILRIWYEPHHKEAIKMLIEAMTQWVTEHKVKKVRIEIKRGLKAFQKKWKFYPVSVIMERRV